MTSNLDEECLKAGLWFFCIHVLASVTNYTTHLNGSRLVMMAFKFPRTGMKNGVRDKSFFRWDSSHGGRAVWPDAVKSWIIWAIHTYCFSVGRLPEDITIRMFPWQFSIPCLLKRNKESYIHGREKYHPCDPVTLWVLRSQSSLAIIAVLWTATLKDFCQGVPHFSRQLQRKLPLSKIYHPAILHRIWKMKGKIITFHCNIAIIVTSAYFIPKTVKYFTGHIQLVFKLSLKNESFVNLVCHDLLNSPLCL